MRLEGPGCIAHAELKIGDSVVMLADEFPDMGAISPQSIGGTPVSLLLYVENCDQVYARAIAAGATAIRPLADQFYGDRSGMIADPFGHRWSIATHTEDVPPAEMQRRAAAMMQAKSPGEG